jgi:cysteine synthase
MSSNALDHIAADTTRQPFDPSQPFLEARYLPPELNPFEKRSIRIAALVPSSSVSFGTVETWGILSEDSRSGCRLNLQAHPGIPLVHERYTGPEIVRALGGSPPSMLAIPMHSGGMETGLGMYFKREHPETTIISARATSGGQLTDPPDRQHTAEVDSFPWVLWVHSTSAVARDESLERACTLQRALGIEFGSASGLAWGGLERYLGKLVASECNAIRTSHRSFRSDGFTAVFICLADDAPLRSS